MTRCAERNVRACSLHRQLAEADVCDGVYQLVFLSPEALLSNETWRDTVPSPVYQENLVAVVIDEFYQHSCHVTLGGNVTNYIPLWNENLAHVTQGGYDKVHVQNYLLSQLAELHTFSRL